MKTITLFKTRGKRTPDIGVISYYQDRDVTGIVLETVTGTGVFESKGSARRTPTDEANPEIAELLALSRAFDSMAAGLNRRAQGLIKHAADVAEYKEIQAMNKFSRQVDYEYKKLEESKTRLGRITTRRNPMRRVNW